MSHHPTLVARWFLKVRAVHSAAWRQRQHQLYRSTLKYFLSSNYSFFYSPPFLSGEVDCLSEEKVIVTGVMDTITQEECKDLIKRCGAKLQSSVNGSTTLAVVGTDPGKIIK